MTLFQALIMLAAEICSLCPMKTIRLINGWTYFPLPSIPAISFRGPFSAQWTDSFSPSWQVFTSFFFFFLHKIRPAANSDFVLIDLYNWNACSLMSASYNQKRREKAGLRGPSFQTHPCLGNILLREPPPPCHFSQICGRKRLNRMHSRQCIIHFSMLMAGEKQGCLLSTGAIYHGKYVHPRQVKGWWFCSRVTSNIRLHAGRGLIKATSITQPDNLHNQENKWWSLASLSSLSHIFISFIYCKAILILLS